MRKTAKWEAELWSYLSKGDGIHCPEYQSCRLRLKDVVCLSDEIGERNAKEIRNFIDDDEVDLTNDKRFDLKLVECVKYRKLFRLIDKLAAKHFAERWISSLSIPANLIFQTDDNLPIEVRRVRLQSYHGAVWRLNDCWVIQLNSNDSLVRQRFTLCHEIFHVLAYCQASPVFKKMGSTGLLFNEIMADHFAIQVLLPRKLVVARWAEIKNISQMADIFVVPKSVMYIDLKGMSLI